MNIHDIHRGIKKHKRKKRLGRGPGSGHGKTSGRGHKGQKSNAGWSAPPSFQGGQMPLVRRVPKRGFNNRFAVKVAAVNVGQLEIFEDGQEIGIEQLRERDLVHGRFDEVKVLGNGQLTRKLTIAAHRFSASAREKIEQAGGTVVVTPSKIPVAVKQKEARARARAST